MFNNNLSVWLINCTLISNVFLISACTETKYNNSHIENQLLDTSLQIKKVNKAEYIIVLKKDVKITDALHSLKIYKPQLIQDFKRNRYLIRLKINPGIERLQKYISGSDNIKFIQPNFNYKSQ